MEQCTIGARLHCFGGALLSMRRYDEDRQIPAGELAADLSYHCASVHSGHLDVGNNEVRSLSVNLLKSTDAVFSDNNLIAFQLEKDG